MGGFENWRLKRSRAKVRIGLPKKHPNVFKPAFSVPPKLRSLVESTDSKWDDKATVIHNYKSFGFVSNPKLLGVRSRTSHIIQSDSLQLPPSAPSPAEDDPSLDSGSDLEEYAETETKRLHIFSKSDFKNLQEAKEFGCSNQRFRFEINSQIRTAMRPSRIKSSCCLFITECWARR